MADHTPICATATPDSYHLLRVVRIPEDPSCFQCGCPAIRNGDHRIAVVTPTHRSPLYAFSNGRPPGIARLMSKCRSSVCGKCRHRKGGPVTMTTTGLSVLPWTSYVVFHDPTRPCRRPSGRILSWKGRGRGGGSHVPIDLDRTFRSEAVGAFHRIVDHFAIPGARLPHDASFAGEGAQASLDVGTARPPYARCASANG